MLLSWPQRGYFALSLIESCWGEFICRPATFREMIAKLLSRRENSLPSWAAWPFPPLPLPRKGSCSEVLWAPALTERLRTDTAHGLHPVPCPGSFGFCTAHAPGHTWVWSKPELSGEAEADHAQDKTVVLSPAPGQITPEHLFFSCTEVKLPGYVYTRKQGVTRV